mgnify:CR=1 FL=1
MTHAHFAIGSHLKVARLGYSHHGIYFGNGYVIHYAGLCEGLKSAPIEITTLDIFQGKAKKIEVVSYAGIKCFSPDEIIKRAMSRLGENKYHLITNNCEHFAIWSKTNISESYQVKNKMKYLSVKLLLQNHPPIIRSSYKPGFRIIFLFTILSIS